MGMISSFSTVFEKVPNGKKTVFTCGCFDLIHPGHLRYLKAAKEFGDFLIVTVNEDASVRADKGFNRPIISENFRAEMVAGLACVDLAAVGDVLRFETVLESDEEFLSKLKPDVLVLWLEPGKENARHALKKSIEVKFPFIAVELISFHVENFHTSKIIEKITSTLPQ